MAPGSGRRSLAALAAFCFSQKVGASSTYMAELCHSQTCVEKGLPILDYDPPGQGDGGGGCVCRAHPCWDDEGQAHSCATPEHPYLSFHYEEDKTLTCSCSSIPHHASVHVSKDLCAGHKCHDESYPVLDYDEDKEECLCRAHPCWNDDGKKHACDKEDFPILRYRLDKKDGKSVTVCECQAFMEKDGGRPLMHAEDYDEAPDFDGDDLIQEIDDDEDL